LLVDDYLGLFELIVPILQDSADGKRIAPYVSEKELRKQRKKAIVPPGIENQFQLTVVPQLRIIEDIPDFYNSCLQSGELHSHTVGEFAEFTDVRPYAPNDSMRHIHWKLSAKRGEWIVKSYEPESSNEATVFFDMSILTSAPRRQALAEDNLLETGLSVCYYCVKHRISLDVFTGGQDRFYVRSIADFEELYRLTPLLDFSADFSMTTELADFLALKTYPQNIVVISNNVDDELAGYLADARLLGHNVILFHSEAYLEPEAAEHAVAAMRRAGLG
jgi:uncharacterized protein (DUF58 family)